MRSGDRPNLVWDGPRQTHNPLISPPSTHPALNLEWFTITRLHWVISRYPGIARARIFAKFGVSWFGRLGGECGARGRCVRDVGAAPPQPRLPAWKFDFSDVSSAPHHDRTARHMNSYPPLILHVHTAITSTYFMSVLGYVEGRISYGAWAREFRSFRSTHLRYDLDIFVLIIRVSHYKSRAELNLCLNKCTKIILRRSLQSLLQS